MKCRHCNNELTNSIIDLQHSPISNDLLSIEQLSKSETYYPLKVMICDKCFLVQIDELKKKDEIFSNEYVYFSSYSQTWLNHAKKYTHSMIKRFGFNSENFVVEIASNDGYLLQYFKEQNIPVLGIEPTQNTAEVAQNKNINTIIDFFSEEFAKKQFSKQKADLLIGNNVLAHVPNINNFIKGLKIALAPNGVITMEFPHLLNMIKHNQFDTIYHEHFSYLSLHTVNKMFESFGLKVFDVEEIKTHGGSLRIFAKHKNDDSKIIMDSVSNLLKKEQEFGITDIKKYNCFEQNAKKIKYNFTDFLLQAKKQNKKVVAYGAPAKGNTILNYCGIKNDLIDFCVDVSPHKQGKFLPGSHIPIKNPNELKTNKPDFIIIMPWNIQDEIINQHSYIKEWGGKFVLLIPDFQILP